MEGSSFLSFSSLKTHFKFGSSIHFSTSSPPLRQTYVFSFNPNQFKISGFWLKNPSFNLSSSSFDQTSFLSSTFPVTQQPLETAKDSLRDNLPKIDKSGRFCSPRAAKPGYEFDNSLLLEYNHMNFGGPSVSTQTEEEAEDLLQKIEKDSAIEAAVLSAPPNLTKKMIGAIVDGWDTHVAAIDKIAPPNWKSEPGGKVLEFCILHLAMAEITILGTRHQIIINEAVDLSKRFGDGTAPRLINGCLRTFVKDHSGKDMLQQAFKTKS